MAAAVTYVSQPFQAGPRLLDGSDLNRALAADIVSSTQNAAASGTTFATATAIASVLANFTTVAVSGAATLPKSVPGTICTIFNNGAQTLTIYPAEASGSTIDGAASTTLTTANRAANFFCVAPNVWLSALLGAVSS